MFEDFQDVKKLTNEYCAHPINDFFSHLCTIFFFFYLEFPKILQKFTGIRREEPSSWKCYDFSVVLLTSGRDYVLMTGTLRHVLGVPCSLHNLNTVYDHRTCSHGPHKPSQLNIRS